MKTAPVLQQYDYYPQPHQPLRTAGAYRPQLGSLYRMMSVIFSYFFILSRLSGHQTTDTESFKVPLPIAGALGIESFVLFRHPDGHYDQKSTTINAAKKALSVQKKCPSLEDKLEHIRAEIHHMQFFESRPNPRDRFTQLRFSIPPLTFHHLITGFTNALSTATSLHMKLFISLKLGRNIYLPMSDETFENCEWGFLAASGLTFIVCLYKFTRKARASQRFSESREAIQQFMTTLEQNLQTLIDQAEGLSAQLNTSTQDAHEKRSLFLLSNGLSQDTSEQDKQQFWQLIRDATTQSDASLVQWIKQQTQHNIRMTRKVTTVTLQTNLRPSQPLENNDSNSNDEEKNEPKPPSNQSKPLLTATDWYQLISHTRNFIAINLAGPWSLAVSQHPDGNLEKISMSILGVIIGFIQAKTFWHYHQANAANAELSCPSTEQIERLLTAAQTQTNELKKRVDTQIAKTTIPIRKQDFATLQKLADPKLGNRNQFWGQQSPESLRTFLAEHNISIETP